MPQFCTVAANLTQLPEKTRPLPGAILITMSKPRITKPRITRRQIDEDLLVERLGLDDDWLNRDEDGTANLPDDIPAFLIKTRRKAEIADLQQTLDQLVAAGCRRGVLYFCLEQLSPDAEEIRAGREWASTPNRNDEDDSIRKRTTPLATHEDMKAVSNNARAARDVIRRYERELLLAAATKTHELPTSLMSRPDCGENALSLLEASLTWVSKLADAYTAPYQATLLKSKGLLYLAAYVYTYAKSPQLRAQQRHAEKKIGTGRMRTEKRAKRDVRPHDHALTNVLTICTGKDGGWSPSDVRTKLSKFKADHPQLHHLLLAKLTELHNHADQ